VDEALWKRDLLTVLFDRAQHSHCLFRLFRKEKNLLHDGYSSPSRFLRDPDGFHIPSILLNSPEDRLYGPLKYTESILPIAAMASPSLDRVHSRLRSVIPG
jgi:hypothetical protein